MDSAAQDLVTALPGATAAAVIWRARGRLHVTVVAKATFAFAPEAEMPPVPPQQLFSAEVYHGAHAPRTVRCTSDLVPYLGHADVVFTGFAHAPPGTAVQSMPVRITIFDGDRMLLDKALIVQDAAPFQRMPIVYERTTCGADRQENPFGVDPSAGPAACNIVDPRDPQRPAGFGPIARTWPARKRLLGGTPRAALEGPIQEIPDIFEWSYFQAAPADQRIGYLRGGEWLVLQGLHPAVQNLRMRLPEARGLARMYGLSAFGVAEGEPLKMQADTLRIDGEEQRCTVVFRRSIPVADEATLAAARIVVGVELPGAPLQWPSSIQEIQALARGAGAGAGAADRARGTPGAQTHSGSETVVLAGEAPDAASTSALPFRPGMAPAVAPSETRAPALRLATGTFALGADSEEATLVAMLPTATPATAATAALPPTATPATATTAALPPTATPGASVAPALLASETLAISPQNQPAPGSTALPFQPLRPGATSPLQTASAGQVSPHERLDSGTLALSPDVEHAAPQDPLPFSAPQSAPPPPLPPPTSPPVPRPRQAPPPLPPRPGAAADARKMAPERNAPPSPPSPPSPPAPRSAPPLPPPVRPAAAPSVPPPAAPSVPPAAAPSSPPSPPPASTPPAPSRPITPPSPPPQPARVLSVPTPAASNEPPAPPAPPAPPRKPPAAPELPNPSPALKRNLYERFGRK